MAAKIYRLHYRGQLKKEASSGYQENVIRECVENVRRAQAEGRVLTAALYQCGRMLFLYYEAVGEPMAVAEPAAMEGHAAAAEPAAMEGHAAVAEPAAMEGHAAVAEPAAMEGHAAAPGTYAGAESAVCSERYASASGVPAVQAESGEDVQATCVRPEELLMPLEPFLQLWPGQKSDRLWVHMYHIYYHSVPESPKQWERAAVPEKRRGRIAFLRDDKLFSYTYFHKAIVDEGLLEGDKYQSIALHENILFSYFEEPRTFVNIRGDASGESQVIKDWMAADPESHFIHMPQGKGENFMFLPALFAVGVEDTGVLKRGEGTGTED